MEKHWNLTDDVFEKQFKSKTLDPLWFTHEAHLRLAWIHIQKYGIAKAHKTVAKQIHQYTIKLGASDKFHATLTAAAVNTVYHFMLKDSEASFKNLIATYPRLKYDFKTLLHCHYTSEVLFSERAKHKVLAPDLLAYDR